MITKTELALMLRDINSQLLAEPSRETYPSMKLIELIILSIDDNNSEQLFMMVLESALNLVEKNEPGFKQDFFHSILNQTK